MSCSTQHEWWRHVKLTIHAGDEPAEYFIVLFFCWIYIVLMPTVLRTGPYRIYFHSHDPNEPPHVHIDREDFSAKFWLHPVHLARNVGFRSAELLNLEEIVAHNKDTLLEAWYGYFGKNS